MKVQQNKMQVAIIPSSCAVVFLLRVSFMKKKRGNFNSHFSLTVEYFSVSFYLVQSQDHRETKYRLKSTIHHFQPITKPRRKPK